MRLYPVEGLLAAAPGALPGGEGARVHAGLVPQGVGSLAGEGGPEYVVACAAVGPGDGGGGGLAGVGADDDQDDDVAGGGSVGGARWSPESVGPRSRARWRSPGSRRNSRRGGELARGSEESPLVAQIVGRGVVGHAAGVLAEAHTLARASLGRASATPASPVSNGATSATTRGAAAPLHFTVQVGTQVGATRSSNVSASSPEAGLRHSDRQGQDADI